MINMNFSGPAKWFVIVSAGISPPLETCGGEEYELTNDEAGFLDNCSATSEVTECKLA